MIGSPPTPLAESVALFERSANYALEGLSGVTDADLDRPTPCTGWDLRKLVMHLADAADALTDLITTGKLSLPTPPRSGDAAPVAVAQDRTHCLLDALRSAIHRDTVLRKGDQTLWARNAAHGGAIEFAAHGWDIATACGAERQIPAGLATELLELSRSLINDQTRRPQFGPPVYISPTATANDRLVAFLGRQPASRS
jgi:uncharacterized protein (TIGR03086 family)